MDRSKPCGTVRSGEHQAQRDRDRREHQHPIAPGQSDREQPEADRQQHLGQQVAGARRGRSPRPDTAGATTSRRTQRAPAAGPAADPLGSAAATAEACNARVQQAERDDRDVAATRGRDSQALADRSDDVTVKGRAAGPASARDESSWSRWWTTTFVGGRCGPSADVTGCRSPAQSGHDHRREPHQALRTTTSPSTTSPSPANPAPSPASSARTAPASPPRCACSPASPRRPSGRVTIDGRPYADLPNPGRLIGVMLDAAAQHPGRTGLETLRMTAQLLDLPRSRRRRDARAGRPRRRRQAPGRQLLARHAAAPRHRQRADRRPGRPGARRAGQRHGPRGHPLDARAAARLRRPRRHGAAVQPPARRGAGHRRPSGRHRERPDRRQRLARRTAGRRPHRRPRPGRRRRWPTRCAAPATRSSVDPTAAITVDATAEQVGRIAAASGQVLLELRDGGAGGLEDLFFTLTAPGADQSASRRHDVRPTTTAHQLSPIQSPDTSKEAS